MSGRDGAGPTTESGRCIYADWDASYVLGALSAADRATFEAHLPTCPGCRRAVREVAGLPGLLSRVGEADLSDPEPLPQTLWPRLAAAARRTHRREWWRTAAAGFAAAACVVGLAIAAWAVVDHARQPATANAVSRTFAPAPGITGLSAQASLEDLPWGTRIVMHCLSDQNGYREDRYAMVVIGRDGAEHPVGSWVGQPGKTVRIEADTFLRRNQIASIEVRAADGLALLTLRP